MDKSIYALARSFDPFVIGEGKDRMLDVMIVFQVTSRLETHQRHANSIKLLNRFDFIRSDDNFFLAHWVKVSDVMLEESLTSFIAFISLCAPQKVIIHCIYFLSCSFLDWNNRAVQGEADFRPRRNFEDALAKCSFLELSLSDTLN